MFEDNFNDIIAIKEVDTPNDQTLYYLNFLTFKSIYSFFYFFGDFVASNCCCKLENYVSANALKDYYIFTFKIILFGAKDLFVVQI